jgi:hypothetical protein
MICNNLGVSHYQRIRQLIDSVHAGNVNAASKALGMPQRTLAAIVSGEIKDPRGRDR